MMGYQGSEAVLDDGLAPLIVITDGHSAQLVGIVSRSARDCVVVGVDEALAEPPLPEAVVAVNDPDIAIALLDRYASAGCGVRLAVAPALRAGGDRFRRALSRFDAAAIDPTGDAAVLRLRPAATSPGTAPTWAERVQPPATAQAPARAAAEPAAATADPEPTSPQSARRVLGSLLRRHSWLAPALLGAMAALGAAVALLRFASDPAIAWLSVLFWLVMMATLGLVVEVYRQTRAIRARAGRAVAGIRDSGRRVTALEGEVKRVRRAVAGATSVAAGSALNTRELISGLKTRGTEDGTRAISEQVGGLDRKLTAQAEQVAELDRKLAGRAEQLDHRQLNEVQALLQLRDRYPTDGVLPPVSGWAMNPTGLLWLTQLVEQTRPSLIVECGSGTSTVWLGLALRRNGHGRLVSLENHPDYLARTTGFVAAHGLSEIVEVRGAALVDTATPRGSMSWYELPPTLLSGIDLLVVDGPPGQTGSQARYPALPVLRERLSPGAIVVLDDTGRQAEQDILQLWADDVAGVTRLGAVAPGVEALAVG